MTSVELHVHYNVQIAPVLWVRAARYLATNLLPLADGQHVPTVEDGLLPMGVLRKGRGGEAYRLVHLREGALEIGREAVQVVVPVSP